MTNATTFKIVALDTVPAADGLTNIVSVVRSQVVVTDGTYSAQQTFEDTVSPPDPASFTAFDALTEAAVLAWIPDHGTDQTVIDYLAADIVRQANPPIVTRAPAWG